MFVEKTNELVDSAKHTAHDANVKAHELAESAEEKLEAAEKAGRLTFLLKENGISF